MSRSQKGFTIIELVIVIVILGLLAALAIPKYIAIQQQARIAVVNGMAGGLRGAVALARAQYMAAGNMAALNVTMDGGPVVCNVGTGIPVALATGITAAMQDTTGFFITYVAGPPATASFTPGAAALVNCRAIYTYTVGPPASGIVTVDTTVCP